MRRFTSRVCWTACRAVRLQKKPGFFAIHRRKQTPPLLKSVQLPTKKETRRFYKTQQEPCKIELSRVHPGLDSSSGKLQVLARVRSHTHSFPWTGVFLSERRHVPCASEQCFYFSESTRNHPECLTPCRQPFRTGK